MDTFSKVFVSAVQNVLDSVTKGNLKFIFHLIIFQLVLLSKNGRVLVYTAKGKGSTKFYMDAVSFFSLTHTLFIQGSEAINMCSAKIFHQPNAKIPISGLACLKDTGQLFAVNNVESPNVWRVPDVACNLSIY